MLLNIFISSRFINIAVQWAPKIKWFQDFIPFIFIPECSQSNAPWKAKRAKFVFNRAFFGSIAVTAHHLQSRSWYLKRLLMFGLLPFQCWFLGGTLVWTWVVTQATAVATRHWDEDHPREPRRSQSYPGSPWSGPRSNRHAWHLAVQVYPLANTQGLRLDGMVYTQCRKCQVGQKQRPAYQRRN